ncbi:MAG: phenylalanine--tRNA ligase subunit beta [Gammaproteobacteria bacterium]|jgi:phenylalanyl-tRNA synthetase beta chain|nr:phenylalanine--tRNA ligase subunit beta [Gammaproteobacteria bacterium]
MKFSEKWLREWVNPQLSTKELSDNLTMAGLEVEGVEAHSDDTVIEIDFTPNRGDCLSVSGLAREIAALLHIPLMAVKINAVKPVSQEMIKINVEDKASCPIYIGRIIRNIRTNQTPKWLQDRLEKCDIRCIHPVVDVLNYVMLELGQPMHAFDVDKLKTPITVRKAFDGEKLKLLDESEVSLNVDTLVIADSSGPQAIAGIMGGKDSGVTDGTSHILLESALFSASHIAGKARRYGLHTDSSFRFERGVDSGLQGQAMERATELIIQICGGEVGPLIEVLNRDALPAPKMIVLRYERLIKLIGHEIPKSHVNDILQHLGCEIIHKEDLQWSVFAPSYRYDLTTEVDLIEEVVRIVGYNNIPNHLPQLSTQFLPQSESKVSVSRLKRALVDLGYQEVITYSFVDDNIQKILFPTQASLPLVNPISADMGVMRVSLWPGLIGTLKYNQNRQQQRMHIFESGLCFNFDQEGKLHQEAMLGGLVYGDANDEHWDNKKRPADFFDVKHHVESLWQLLGYSSSLEFTPIVAEKYRAACHPGQCAQILWQGKAIGVIGKLHPQLYQSLDVNGPIFVFELSLGGLTHKTIPVYQRPSKFPEIRRDIAVIVDQPISSDSLINFVRKSAGETLRDVKIFDVYTGKGIDSGRKSIAMGLILQHPSRTLVDKEVDDVIHTVVTGLKKEFSADLRD